MTEFLNDARRFAFAMQLAFEITCDEIQKLLATENIPMLVLKGPHVGDSLYEEPAERSYCDLDILVHPEHYYKAATVLLDHGFTLFSVNHLRLAAERADYQLRLFSPRGVPVELHRSLADRDQFVSDVVGFFDRAQSFSFGEASMNGLGQEDLLLHLCLHFGKRHFATNEKKNLLDIALLLQKKTVVWPVFYQRARTARCRIISHYVLLAAQLQHGAVIPPAVLGSLRPSPWRRRLLDKYLDPAVFPVYRFKKSPSPLRERMVNLLLLDRFSTMISSSFRFAGRSAMNWFLRIGMLRRLWLKCHPLRKWMAEAMDDK